MYSFPYLEAVCCSMSSSNCCFLTFIQISQEAGQVFWYSQLLKNFPEFVVVHTVKGFGIVNKTEVDVIWTSLAFSLIQWMLAIWSLVPLPFLNPDWASGSSRFMYLHGTGEIDSWRTQIECYVYQDPGERSSDPTRDWPKHSRECPGVSCEAWVGGGLLQGWGHWA